MNLIFFTVLSLPFSPFTGRGSSSVHKIHTFATRWSAKKCFEKHYYLCQHPMPFVGDRARQRVYTKWNETYPGQFANEVQVFVATNGTNRR